MSLDAESCYRALSARDRRFDGLFFVGVETTGIYCRPICPARTPGRDRCRFFRVAAEAERAGFRACFRCRPEHAPGAHDALPELVRRATHAIEDGALEGGSLAALAERLGVSDRHLRRAFADTVGVSPIELVSSRRLALARQLVAGGELGMTEIAYASGFGSVRRFNAAFRARFGAPPTAVRARRRDAGVVRVRLDYRPPLEWALLLDFLRARAIPGVEIVDDRYRRSAALDGAVGFVAVHHDPRRPALVAELSTSLAPRLMNAVARLRRLFDLDAHPARIAEALARDPLLAPRVRARPGLRVPGAFDGFEVALRVVLGQQVSVAAATTLSGRLAAAFGRPFEGGGLERLSPTAESIAGAELSGIGLTRARADTLRALARAVQAGLRLDPGASLEETERRLLALRGVGPWTASAIAMRALAWPDAFPSGDLVLRRALDLDRPAAVERRAEAWRPWRAYAAMQLFTPFGGP